MAAYIINTSHFYRSNFTHIALKLTDPEYKFGQTFTGCSWFVITEVCWDFTYEIYVGWRVDQVATDYAFYNLTYVSKTTSKPL
jgi:hypothetical protein